MQMFLPFLSRLYMRVAFSYSSDEKERFPIAHQYHREAGSHNQLFAAMQHDCLSVSS